MRIHRSFRPQQRTVAIVAAATAVAIAVSVRLSGAPAPHRITHASRPNLTRTGTATRSRPSPMTTCLRSWRTRRSTRSQVSYSSGRARRRRPSLSSPGPATHRYRQLAGRYNPARSGRPWSSRSPAGVSRDGGHESQPEGCHRSNHPSGIAWVTSARLCAAT